MKRGCCWGGETLAGCPFCARTNWEEGLPHQLTRSGSERKSPVGKARLSPTKFQESRSYVCSLYHYFCSPKTPYMLRKYSCPEGETNEVGNYRWENLQVGHGPFLTSLYSSWPGFQAFLSMWLWTNYNFSELSVLFCFVFSSVTLLHRVLVRIKWDNGYQCDLCTIKCYININFCCLVMMIWWWWQ